MNSIKLKLTPIEYSSLTNSFCCKFIDDDVISEIYLVTNEFFTLKIISLNYQPIIATGKLKAMYNRGGAQLWNYIYSDDILILGDLK